MHTHYTLSLVVPPRTATNSPRGGVRATLTLIQILAHRAVPMLIWISIHNTVSVVVTPLTATNSPRGDTLTPSQILAYCAPPMLRWSRGRAVLSCLVSRMCSATV